MLYTRKREKNGRTRRIRAFLIFIFIAVVLLTAFISYFTTIKPIVTSIATSQVEVVMMKSVNDAAIRVLSSQDVGYEDIITVSMDECGKIASLTANSVLINIIKSRFVNEVVDNIESHSNNSVKIPIGSILSPTFFSGHGPDLCFDLMPVSSVYADFESSFVTAGINQTRHIISVKITVSSGVYLPGYSAETTIETRMIVAETVIVGSIPNDFTNLEGLNDRNSFITDIL